MHHWHANMLPDEIVLVHLGSQEWEDVEELDIPCEPAGHGAIATGNVQSCKEFWRSFVRSAVVMD